MMQGNEDIYIKFFDRCEQVLDDVKPHILNFVIEAKNKNTNGCNKELNLAIKKLDELKSALKKQILP